MVYFSFENPAGYVIHREPEKYKQIFWISVGPLVLNSFLTLILGSIASGLHQKGWIYLVILWLALSVGMHAFPSDEDMENVSYASKQSLKQNGSIFHYFVFPFIWIIWIANKLKFFWFDAIYAIGLISLVGGFN